MLPPIARKLEIAAITMRIRVKGRGEKWLTSGSRGNAKGGDAAHDAKDILIAYRRDLSFCAVGTFSNAVQQDVLASSFEDLLIAGLESWNHIAQYGSRGGRRRFESEGVERLGLLYVGHGGREEVVLRPVRDG